MMRALLFIALLLAACSLAPRANAASLFVVGHKGSFGDTEKSRVAEYYLLKRKMTGAGDVVIPINLPSEHPLRNAFSQALFNRSPLALGEYWDRMSFRGIKPPVVQSSEQAVILFVGRIKGAIGYVSRRPDADSGVVILQEIPL